MKITFDNNVWEKVFSDEDHFSAVSGACRDGRISSYICESAFRIGSIRKVDRSTYFREPHFGSRFEGIVEREGKSYIKMSFGPEDEKHPGLPKVQIRKLEAALQCGAKVMRGTAWMGLPQPHELLNAKIFVPETKEQGIRRTHLQYDVMQAIEVRGVGHAVFKLAGGWSADLDSKEITKACAEWADGELVAAHVAYGNDILCTNDRAQQAGKPAFDEFNRHWFSQRYGVCFITLEDLMGSLS